MSESASTSLITSLITSASTSINATGTVPQELDVFTCPLDGINQIEASAGTGKTWNICGLYLRLLLERALTVQQILVVTFTNAATAELRERIRARIVDTLRALQSPDMIPSDPFVAMLITTITANGGDRTVMQQRLDLALQTFDEAAIFTIHGFCQRALSDAPFAAGMPFASELLTDDSDITLHVVQDFWRRHISSGVVGADLIRYLADCNDHPEKFAKLLQRQIKKSQARIIWPDDIDAPFSASTDALDAAFAAARDLWTPEVAADITELLLASADVLNQQSYKAPAIHAACAQWQLVFATGEASVLFDSSHTKLALLSAHTLKDKTKKNKATPQHVFFAAAEVLMQAQKKAADDLQLARLRLLRTMLTECAVALQQAKRDQSVNSYDDILFNVFSALQSDGESWLAMRLLQSYPAALIDEFQDTDPLQFAIFNTIYGAGSHPLFFVGDPKQAIYSFRSADLHTYLQAQKTASARYSLADNQRSSAALISAQNALFGANSGAFILPDLHYQPVHFGKKPRAQFIDRSATTASLQLWTLHDEDENLPTLVSAKQNAAQATAAEIARLLTASEHGLITLDGRPLRAGDIAVLVKSHAQGSAIRRALAALQVGCVELSQAGIFSSVDAMETERILQAIMEPARLGLLLAALATEIFGHDAHSIDALASDETAHLAQSETLLRYRTLWRDRGVGFMFRRLLSEQGVASRMLARPDGERRMTNLLHLTEILHQAAIAHPAPDALLRWLSTQRREARVDEASQLRLESDQNLVQIMTIHRAKGLEYPIVFCPFLWQGRLVANTDNPEGYEYHDDDQHSVIDLRPEPDDLDMIKQKIKEEQAAEFVRLMYVALTRAAHRCYLVAGCYLQKTPYGGVSNKESTHSLLNWLVAGNGVPYAAWSKSTIEPAAIAAAWRNLTAQHPGAFGLAPIPTAPGSAVALARHAADTLMTQPLPTSLPDGWRMTSFSALQHATGNQFAGSDRDTRPSYALQSRAAPPTSVAADDILRFPRGPGAGDTLHAILENIDFADAMTWTPAIRNGLLSHPQTLAGVARDQQLELQEQMVRRMVSDITQTPLTDDVRLCNVPRKRCLPELEFNLPVTAIDPHRLHALLQQGGYDAAVLDFKKMSGYLKGYIDLVFESQGKFYLLDWKSNYLGAQAADYNRPYIDQAMRDHGYHLQSLLYTVALHRYLQRRVADYRYATHFGGVFYVFLRGVRPHWKTTGGTASGVYFHKPEQAIVDQLDHLFAAHPDRNTP